MVKKLKNQKGFTLVELLAVIVILGIIAAIAVPSISGIISNTQEKADEAEKEVIIEAARTAHAIGTDDDGNGGFNIGGTISQEITVDQLISEGYLEDTDIDGTVTYTSANGFTFTEDTD